MAKLSEKIPFCHRKTSKYTILINCIIPTIYFSNDISSNCSIQNFSTILVMCIYEQVLNDIAKSSADQKLISDIKDAVEFLNEEKFKLTETSMKFISFKLFITF